MKALLVIIYVTMSPMRDVDTTTMTVPLPTQTACESALIQIVDDLESSDSRLPANATIAVVSKRCIKLE